MTRPCHAIAVTLTLWSATLSAHDGPPYPIVSNQVLGRLRVSVWTDPDTTDDGTKGGQFWVMVDPVKAGDRVPSDLRARVVVRPLDRPGPEVSGEAAPVEADPARQFVALLMDHEGRFAVHVEIVDGGASSSVDAEVQATYDARPPSTLLALYALPFVFVGFLWTKLLLRRRQARRTR
jgi:hypothetical protein